MMVIEEVMSSAFGAHLTESLLPRLQLRFRKPAPALRPFIKHYWFARTPAVGASRYRTYTDGAMGFVFDLTCPENSFFEGPRRVTMPLNMVASSEFIGVRFAVGGISQFMRGFAEHGDQQTPLSCMPQFWKLLPELTASPNPNQQVQILDRFFINQARRLDCTLVARKEWLLPLLPTPRPVLMKAVSEQLGITQRHLNRVFKTMSGYSPKQLADMLRVDAIRRTLTSSPDTDIQDLVYRLGYHDQAHLITQFKVHTQTTPAAYRNKKQRQMATVFNSGTEMAHGK